MLRFYLYRRTDVSGISGTGRIADGVRFADGTVALRWNTDTASTGIYASMSDVELIHGHNGATHIMWIDVDAA